MPRSVIAAGFLSLFLLGATQSFFGPAQFAMREVFGVSASGVGTFLSALFAGSVSGILLYPFLERRLAMRGALLTASALLMVGCGLVASSSLWAVALGAAFLTGLGYGGAEIGFNALFSRGFGERSASMTNLLHMLFGLGSVLGPFFVGVLHGDFRVPFWAAAFGAAVLLVLSASARFPSSSAAVDQTQSGAFRVTPGLLMFIALFFMYVVTEVGTGSSEPRHLHDALGYSEQLAAFINSLFWGGLTVGRLLGASVGSRLSASSLVVGSVSLLLVALLLAHLPVVAPFAYALAGLACGPIFPTALVWLARTVPGGVAATSLVVAAASGGGMVAAQAVNLIAVNASLVPTALSVYAALMLLLAVGLLLTRGHQHA